MEVPPTQSWDQQCPVQTRGSLAGLSNSAGGDDAVRLVNLSLDSPGGEHPS